MRSRIQKALAVFALPLMPLTVFGLHPAQAQTGELVVYTYYVYNDPGRTDLREIVTGRCGGYGQNVFVVEPFVSTPYYDKEPAYYCTGSGPAPLDY